jgi:hypothetical protein
MAKQWGLQQTNKRVKFNHERNVNPEHFYDIKLPEVAYFLGYFWADGHIHTYKNEKKNLTYHRIAIEVQKEDGDHLRKVAETFGRWAVVERTRKRYGAVMKPTLSLVVNNVPLYEFLLAHGYNEKSTCSPTKILAHLPADLRPAFWLGFFDGDGWLTPPRQTDKGWRRGSNLGFTGSYEQDWSDLEEMLNGLGVVHTVGRNEFQGNHSSRVCAYTRSDIIKFYRYIEPFAYLGLPRKQAKFATIVTMTQATGSSQPEPESRSV